jgi:transposase InsO family protein
MRNLTAEQFLLALRRFISIYGAPKQLHSDNAGQFKLTEKVVDKAWNDIQQDCGVNSYIANQGIQWHFIPSHAPWMGGFYERLIGLVKRSLKKTLGRSCLDYGHLVTVTSEIAAILNTRPIVYLGDDINSGFALTPQCFLRMQVNVKTGTPVLTTETDQDDPDYIVNQTPEEVLTQIWKEGQVHLNRFWRSWYDDYLLSLRERHRQPNLQTGRVLTQHPITVGDIVLIHDTVPRGSWRLGRVTELIQSRDGEIRAANVMLPSKNILCRPLNLLYPLECSKQESIGDDSRTDITDTKGQEKSEEDDVLPSKGRPKRQAALKARAWLKDLLPILNS